MVSDNQMISGSQASWIFMLDMLAAGLFSLTAAKEQTAVAYEPVILLDTPP